MTLDIINQVRIQAHIDYWYTVEDAHFEVGGPGCTISYWELPSGVNTGDKRVNSICMNQDEAIALADAIHKLFKTKLYD